jgi:hypothetical protein
LDLNWEIVDLRKSASFSGATLFHNIRKKRCLPYFVYRKKDKTSSTCLQHFIWQARAIKIAQEVFQLNTLKKLEFFRGTFAAKLRK